MNYKKTYVDANGNVFVNSAVYETVPANLEKLFVVKDAKSLTHEGLGIFNYL